MTLVNKMSEEDYTSVVRSRSISCLANSDLPFPLKGLGILSYSKRLPYSSNGRALAINGAIYFTKEDTDDENGEVWEWFFMHDNSRDIANQMKKRLEQTLSSYSFKIEKAFSAKIPDYERNFFEHKGFDSSKFASVRITRDGKEYGNVRLVDSVIVDLGGNYGYDRKIDANEDVVVANFKEDLRMATVTLDTALNILASNKELFSRRDESNEIQLARPTIGTIEIKPQEEVPKFGQFGYLVSDINKKISG